MLEEQPDREEPELDVDALDPDGEQPEGEQGDDEGEQPEGEQPEGEHADDEGEQPEGEQPEGGDKRAGDAGEQEGRQPSRSSRRIEALVAENREKDRRYDELNRKLDGLLQQRQQPVETPEQREQRFALMTPEDRLRTELQESEQRNATFQRTVTYQLQDTSDKSSFDAKALVDPLYAKWGPKVEGALAELRAKGQNVPRDALLKYLIGEHALKSRKTSGANRQRQAAGDRVRRSTTRPGDGRSDSGSQRRQTGNSVEKRLDNVPI